MCLATIYEGKKLTDMLPKEKSYVIEVSFRFGFISEICNWEGREGSKFVKNGQRTVLKKSVDMGKEVSKFRRFV